MNKPYVIVTSQTIDGVYSEPVLLLYQDFEAWCKRENLREAFFGDLRDSADMHLRNLEFAEYSGLPDERFDFGYTEPYWSVYFVSLQNPCI